MSTIEIGKSSLGTTNSLIEAASSNIAGSVVEGYKESAMLVGCQYIASSTINKSSGTYILDSRTNFEQGALRSTTNPLDIAISGNGFFVLGKEGSGSKKFTRLGAFKVLKDKSIVSFEGDNLLGYPVDEKGFSLGSSESSLVSLKIPTNLGSPYATSNIEVSSNLPFMRKSLDSRAINEFNADDKTTYNHKYSFSIFDSLGNPHKLTSYYLKPGYRAVVDDPNQFLGGVNEERMIDASTVAVSKDDRSSSGKTAWAVFYELDGRPVNPVDPETQEILTADNEDYGYFAASSEYFDDKGNKIQNVTFPDLEDKISTTRIGVDTEWSPHYLFFKKDENGNNILTKDSSSLSLQPLGDVDNGVGALHKSANQKQQINIKFPVSSNSFYAGQFSINDYTVNGSAVGNLSGLEISRDGLISASFSNGDVKHVGRAVLAKFKSLQGLSKNFDGTYKASSDSGAPIYGEAGGVSFGSIRSNQLEKSNVDLTKSLLDLMVAENTYSACSKIISVGLKISETVVQLG